MHKKVFVLSTLFCYSSLPAAVGAAEADKKVQSRTETVTVTATRIERASENVPAAVSVIDEERLETAPMFNVSETLSEVPGVLINSGNGGYDARLIIRGAGLKANYGIREIMLLRDGVPLTDPDSFTRLDFVDTQDVERIEVSRGPGNLYTAGSAGGTIQIISKSVFDMTKNTARLAAGDYGAFNAHLRYAGDISEEQAGAVTFSHRRKGNDWRRHNEFDTSQMSFKHGMFLGSDKVWETELSYTEANMQIPGDMNDAQYSQYLQTGEQTDNNHAFKHSGRYSKIWYINSQLELPYADYTFKPRFYFNEYSQLHPVTGVIVDTPASRIAGLDLEMHDSHKLGEMAADFAGGITYRLDSNKNDKRYAYADVVTGFGGRITRTLSDEKGELIEIQNTDNALYGFFIQESLQLNNKLLLDVGARVDKAKLKQEINEIRSYSYALGRYVTGAGVYQVKKSFTLWSPRLGLSYSLNNNTHAFLSLAQADQVPFESELENNPNLDKATVRNYEVGLKGRSAAWSYDVSVYIAKGKNEVVTTLENGQSLYSNAGATEKKGLELSADFEASKGLRLGLNYAYSDYHYESFIEVVSGIPEDRSGKELPYIPRHKYTVFANYKNASGITARVSADSWGRYWLDNENTERYSGYDFVTNLFFGWEHGAHRLGLNVDNVFDKRYAIEVTKDTRGTRSYVPGTPRSFLLSYNYAFSKGN